LTKPPIPSRLGGHNPKKRHWPVGRTIAAQFRRPQTVNAADQTTNNGAARIEFNRLSGPVVFLAGGYSPSSTSLPTPEIIAGWIDASNTAGSVAFDPYGYWVYTETFDAGPVFGFNDSVAFTFIASGTGTAVTNYKVDLNGVHDESAGDSDDGSSTGSYTNDDESHEGPNENLPQPPAIAPSLQYVLDVTLDSDGNVIHLDRSGHYHNSYYFALIDEPFEDDAEDGGDGEDSEHGYFAGDSYTSTDSGTFTIIVAGWTILNFDTNGATVDIGDHVHFSYQGGGSYGYDPLADTETTDDGGSGDDDTATDGDGGTGDGDDASSPPIRTGSVSGTYSYYGLHDYQGSITGRVSMDDTAAPLTFTVTWIDQIGSVYSGSGSYQDGDTTGTITERGSDNFTDQGSVVLVLTGDDYTLTGVSSIAAQGDGFYFESWGSPLDSDDDEITLTGNAWGTLLIDYSYNDHFDFDLQPIPAGDGGDGDGGDGEFFGDGDDESGGDGTSEGPSQDAPTHHWVFIGGSFDDFSRFASTGGYHGTGTYNTTAGIAAAADGETRSLDTPISGTVAIGGNHQSSITLNAKGTITPDEIAWDVGTLHLFASSDSFSMINASGTINDGALTGTINFYEHQQTKFVRDLTFDLTTPDLPATGTGHDFVLSDTQYDQVASGSIGLNDMSGTQWAQVQDHSYLLISVDYIWTNGDPSAGGDETGDDDEPEDDAGDENNKDDGNLAGWQVTTADFIVTIDSSFDIGYDVSGFVTRDGLSGISAEKASQSGVGFTLLVMEIRPKAADDDGTNVSITFLSNFGRDNSFLSSHNLSGTRTSEPMSPSTVVITGTAWDIGRTESHSSINVSASFSDDIDSSISGSIFLLSQAMIDTGFSGTGSYTRTDGDTTFNGTATHRNAQRIILQ